MPGIFDSRLLGSPIAISPAVNAQPIDTGAPNVSRGGILSRIGDALKDPAMKAALFRAGASMLAGNGVGEGLLAGAGYMDQRRRDESAARRFAEQLALQRYNTDTNAETARRGQNVTMRGQDIGAETARRGQNVTMRGQDIGAKVATRGQDVTMRGQDIGASVARRGQDVTMRGQDIGAETARRGQDITKYVADTESADRRAGFYGSGGGKAPSINQTKGIIDAILPSLSVGYGDPEEVRAAINSNPELVGALSDAAAQGYALSGVSGAIRAAQGVLKGYSYTDDNSSIPFHGRPEFTRKQGAAPAAGGPQKGAMVDGYVFLGGDPNDMRNWRKGA